MKPGDIINSTEAGKLLGVNRKVVASMCQRKEIPFARKVGRDWKIPMRSLDEMFGLARDSDTAPRTEVVEQPAPAYRPRPPRARVAPEGVSTPANALSPDERREFRKALRELHPGFVRR